MATERIYQTDQYCRYCSTKVTDVITRDGLDIIVCESSVFFPEGGGQPSDTGKVLSAAGSFRIKHAFDESLEGDVMHMTDAPAGTFVPGDEVTLEIDWEERFSNMQRHLGEHMLSGTMHNLFGGINRGFHMGADYITIDIELGGRMLSGEELHLAEMTVNSAISSGLPVTVTWFDDYDSSLVMPVRKQVPHDGRVSVVTVGDPFSPEGPYDCIACCGTHPSDSAQVGLVAIYKCEPNKGMNRIFFDCGSKARDRLSSDSRLLAEISKRYSCASSDLLRRLELETAAVSDLKLRVSALSSYVRNSERLRLVSKALSEPDAKALLYSSDILTVDELLKLGFAVSGELPDRLLLILHPGTCTCLLFSCGTPDCGQLVKENAAGFGGRGGGRKDNARAVFGTQADMSSFANSVKKML